MSLPQVDWLVIWKIYHYPYFFWAYTGLSLAIRFLMLRYVNSAALIKTWALSSAASLLILPAMPFVVLPVFALAESTVGDVAVHSLFMALPVAISIALFAGLIDGILLRLLLREAVDRRRMKFLVCTNILVMFSAVGTVLAIMLAHPPQIIAMADSCR